MMRAKDGLDACRDAVAALAAAEPRLLAWLARLLVGDAHTDPADDQWAVAFEKAAQPKRWVARRMAAEALAQLGTPAAIEALAGALGPDADGVGHIATKALAAHGDPRVVPNLIAWCEDGTWCTHGARLLEAVLVASASRVTAADLRACSSLPDAERVSSGPPDWAGEEAITSREPVACDRIRQLARAELTRRGAGYIS